MSPIPFLRILGPEGPCARKLQSTAVAYVMGLQIVWNEGQPRFSAALFSGYHDVRFLSAFPKVRELPYQWTGGRPGYNS